MSNFKQLAGCADSWMINRAGIVKSANGKELKESDDGKVTVKLINGQMRAVKVLELIERNFGDSDTTPALNCSGKEPEAKEPEINPLLAYTDNELEAEIKRRKVNQIIDVLDAAEHGYGMDIVGEAIDTFLGYNHHD